VTDFLPAERARGITIQSAAISFSWPPTSDKQTQQPIPAGARRSSVPHNINLIDTPGHADFTFEVIRSLRVLDGAVCILDGVAGVEAQTEKVWSQASAYAIPKIIFVNKLDRDGAAFGKTVKEVGSRLAIWPAVCSLPWFTEEGQLQGIGDVVGLQALKYELGGDGKNIELVGLAALQARDASLAAELKGARIALVELLSEHDDEMVERYLEADEDHLAISPADITQSLRKCVLQRPQHVAPLFAGASFRNIGVQPLLDAVVDLLPSPNERPDSEISLESNFRCELQPFLAGKIKMDEFEPAAKNKKQQKKAKAVATVQNVEACALAFKVVADPKKGVLVYVRVYSGTLSRANHALWNTTLQNSERAQHLLKMYANDAVQIDSISAGQIGVIPGLKFARTGDTLISFSGTTKNGPPRPINTMQLKPIAVPPPVFFVAVEPNSLSEEKHIKECLNLLLREDPSLHVSVDEESGQTHLAGMGELHLEIARDRLVNDLKAKARIGKIEIGYRETVVTPSGHIEKILEIDVASKMSKAGCSVFIEPRTEEAPLSRDEQHLRVDLHDNNRLTIVSPTLYSDGTPIDEEEPGLLENMPIESIIQAFQQGVSVALSRGPIHRYPIHSVDVKLSFDHTKHIFVNSNPTVLAAAARQAVQAALKSSSAINENIIMEPVMLVTISVDEASMGSVVHDLSASRGASIISLDSADESDSGSSDLTIDPKKIYAPVDKFAGGHTDKSAVTASSNTAKQIIARVPLKEMVGYLKHLRSLTAGRGTFTMVVDDFERMNAQRQRIVLSEMRGGFEY
jgi:elongation factor G